jgi:hypothetical protein
VTTGGMVRWMLSTRKGVFDDYRYAQDRFIVCPGATRKWGERMLAADKVTDADRAILASANQRYVQIRREVKQFRPRVSLLTVRESFLYNRIWSGFPTSVRVFDVPRVQFDDFSMDADVVRGVETLRSTGVPLLLVYLPMSGEIDKGRPLMALQSIRLMRSLERMTGEKFVVLPQKGSVKRPEKMNLLPFDHHPNFDGLRWYANVVADAVTARLDKG